MKNRELRTHISEIFVKWGLSTNQAVINEILTAVETESKAYLMELIGPDEPEDKPIQIAVNNEKPQVVVNYNQIRNQLRKELKSKLTGKVQR